MKSADPPTKQIENATSGPACSPEMEKYFDLLAKAARHCYEIASEAREMGLDPSTEIEMPLTHDLASRVESLVGPKGVADTIRALSKEMDRERLAIEVAIKVTEEGDFPSDEAAMYQAIRTGLAVLTEGVLVAPLEGVISVKIMSNNDGTSYPAIYFAGPIRSAGGTGQAMSVLLGDVVRRKLNLGRYKPTAQEIERYKEEMPIYRQCQHLQYTPSAKEVENIVANCPVCIDGEGTDDEVSGNRDLPRVSTNRTRGGACLVIAEGMVQKSSKILKHVKKLGIDGWDFLESFRKDKVEPTEKVNNDGENGVDHQSDDGTDAEEEDPEELLNDNEDGEGSASAGKRYQYDYMPDSCIIASPSVKYMKDIIAGRPVISHPSRAGGFRLRYGKSRTTGLAATAIHPATMVLLDNFLAVGTQLKIERPGKAGAVTPCDSIEGPIVLLQSGDLIQINEVEWAEKLSDEVKQIVDVGEILACYGEFLENNQNLVPGAFSPEWWHILADRAFEDGANIDPTKVPTPEEAFRMAEEYHLPLHPEYNLFWHDLSTDEIRQLGKFIKDNGHYEDQTLIIPNDKDIKDILVKLGALHIEIQDNLIFDQYALTLVRCSGLNEKMGPRRRKIPRPRPGIDPMVYVSSLAGVTIMPRAPTRVGARMGRPEKAKERKMKPPPHALFPLSQAGGPQRLLKEAAQKGVIEVEVSTRVCLRCRKESILPSCECGGHTVIVREPNKRKIHLGELLEKAKRRLGEKNIPPIKAIQGMISKTKTPEPIEKGILRAKHGIWVFKDGTIRFDMTDVPITHFRPGEIGLSLEKVHELGYTEDVDGKPLTSDGQLLEIKVQDIIVSNRCGRYMVGTAKYVDDLLEKFYGLEPFYNVVTSEDLIGSLMVGLAPHTSAGVLGRLIGYTSSHVGYAHPYWHAAKRRNCDGDEDSVMLLMDCLLNFSKFFLPEKRGGQMDAPLVLSARLDPNEIDKEAQNLDVGKTYPIELYEAAMKGRSPKTIEDLMDVVSNRIGKPEQYEGFHFTHGTSNINMGPKMSSYKTLVKMQDKMEAQFELARKIRAVDASDVAARVIESHFLPDLVGNLKKFSKQSFRCTSCNRKYRRMPLKGICLKCGGNLTMTVHEKGVKKYLEVTKRIAVKYNVPEYTKQRVLLVEKAIDSLFENDKMRKSRLDDFGLDGFM